MEKIIKDYYLAEGSKLVHHQIGTKGVDCWFDADDVSWQQHRRLSFEDFALIRDNELEDLKNECELNSLESQSYEG